MSSSAQSAELLVPARLTRGLAERLGKRGSWHVYRATLVLNDVLGIVLAFRFAYWTRFDLELPWFRLEVLPSPPYYSTFVLALLPTWLVIFTIYGLYQRSNLLGGTKEYELVFRATTFGLMVVIIAGFLSPDMVIARGWLLMAWLCTFLLIAGGRFWCRRLVYALRRRGHFVRPTLIVGTNEEGHLLANQLKHWKTSGLHLIGAVGDKAQYRGDLPFLGTVDDLDRLVEEHNIGEIVIATSALSRSDMLRIFREYGVAKRPNLRLSSGLLEVITTGLEVKEIGTTPLVTVKKVRLTGVDRTLKLMMDYALAIPGLVLVSPLLLMIAIAIKLDSSGPVLHRRRVMGVNGRQFDAYKFRTMSTNGNQIIADRPDLKAKLAEHHKLKDDPRISRLGKHLRRFSLDELPQLLNVLRREMSLVGPRMISPAEMDKYDQWGINLLTVHPGITGLWQVSGRSDVGYEDRIRLDMHYVRNWSIWLDLQLLLRTIPAVLKGSGAY